MGHRIKVLRNFVEPADAEKIIRLVDSGQHASTAVAWMLKKYSDKLIEEHKEEFGWRPHLFTAQAQAFALHSGSNASEYIDSYVSSGHIITSSVIHLGGTSAGGKIVFPNQEFEYQPEPLSAVIFPSGSWEYQHILEPITSGTGYAVAMWHTGHYPNSLQQKYLQENDISLSNLWSANYKAGVCGI